MKREAAEQLIKVLKGKVVPGRPRAEWVTSNCVLGPWRHKEGKSAGHVFGIKLESGDSFAHCFSCGWGGQCSDLVVEMQLNNMIEPHDEYDWKAAMQLIAQAEEELELDLSGPTIDEIMLGGGNQLQEFPNWWLETFGEVGDHDWAIEYLQSRNVGPEVAGIMELKVDTKQRRICAPVRGWDGTLLGLHGRAVDPGVDPRYRMYTYLERNNPIVWLGEHRIDTTKPILVVEGMFDKASCLRVYRNTVSPLFAVVSAEKLNRMKTCLEWVTLLDSGTGGDKGRAKIDKACKDILVQHRMVPEGIKDPGLMQPWQLIETLGDVLELDDLID